MDISMAYGTYWYLQHCLECKPGLTAILHCTNPVHQLTSVTSYQ